MSVSSLKLFLKTNAGTCALVLVLISSLSLNVFLSIKLGRFLFPPPVAIKVKTTIRSPLDVQDQSGNPTSLTFVGQSRPTVLYVLSPNCGWCKRNEANIRALFSATSARYRFIGLSVDEKGLSEYLAQQHIPFPVYLVTSEKQKDKLGLYDTPQTAVITRDGKVQQSWPGAYVGNNLKEIEEYFGVKLPGL